MKRISLAVTVLASCFVLGGQQTAQAYDPNAANNQQFNFAAPGTSLPGVNSGDYYSNPAYDPLFNPNLLTTPSTPLIPNNSIYPGVPSSNPINGRDRVNTFVNPSLNPGVNPNFWNPNLPVQQRRWKLSVMSRDTDTGVSIHSVTQGGAAQRAGLEPGDQIISVNGYQVGYVGGTLYDCASEFDRSADANGWVSLLVLDNRSRQLVNVPIRLDQRAETLNGVVNIPNRQNITANSILNVELREVYGNQGEYTINNKVFNNFANQASIPFSLDFDITQIKGNVQYYIYANVTQNGIETYRVANRVPVIYANGQLQQVAVQLEPVRASNNTTGYRPGVQLDANEQVRQITLWYQKYYNTNPTQAELANALSAVRSGRTMGDVQLSLLASDRFYSLSGANERGYINRLHQVLVDRPANQQEMDYWLNRYVANNRVIYNLAREFMGAVGLY